MQNLSVYSDHADHEVAAFEAHRRIYSAKNPPPVKPDIKSGDTWLMLIGLNVLYLAAVIVSAPHTIPLFLESVPEYQLFGLFNVRYIVAVAAFVMIEIALLMLTYARIKQRARRRETWEHGLESVNKWLSGALILVFVVALGANIYSTLDLSSESDETADAPTNQEQVTTLAEFKVNQAATVSMDETKEGFVEQYGRLAIFLLIGASAPVLALLVGDVSAILWITRQATHREQLADYDRQYDEWNQGCIAAYRPGKLRGLSGNGDMSSAPVRPLLSGGQSSGQDSGHATGQGYKKRTDARQIVREYLLQNRDAIYGNSREIADLIGVGKTTVNDVQKELRTELEQAAQGAGA